MTPDTACAGLSAVVSAPLGTAVVGTLAEVCVETRDEFSNRTLQGDQVGVLVEDSAGGCITIPCKANRVRQLPCRSL